MSLHPKPVDPVPEVTARIAQAAFPKGHPYLTFRDELGTIFQDELFAPLFPRRGQPAAAPWRLALVTILQFAEDLSDEQAADAVRARIDWKYVLSLELDDPGFDASVLCEFRARLVEGDAEHLLLDTLLEWCRDKQLIKAGGKQRTDGTHVLAAVRAINRYELVLETMRSVLDALALTDPGWLCAQLKPEWNERYVRKAEDSGLPSKSEERRALAESVGLDGLGLLQAIYATDAPTDLRDLPAAEILRQVWLQNYQQTEQGWVWRETDNIPPASSFISSPYDLDAHLGRKGQTCWVGYKVHLTETCEEDSPPLILHVETTAAPIADGEVTPRIHQALKNKSLLPSIHIVDTGYLDAALLVSSQAEFGVDLLGPARADQRWQARAGEGFEATHFPIDWENRQARCPEGRTSLSWTPAIDARNNDVIKIKFSSSDCRACPSRERCLHSEKKYARRTLTVRPKDQYEALKVARQRERTPEFVREYARRAGIEGTLSRGVRTCGLRRSRYKGAAKVHLGHVLTAVAINVLRISEWLSEIPRAKTRCSPFGRLVSSIA